MLPNVTNGRSSPPPNPTHQHIYFSNFPQGEHDLYIKVLDKDIMDTDGIGSGKFDFGGLTKGKTERHEIALHAHALDFTANGYVTIEVTLM
jgi:hypothetical protein